MSYLFGCFYNKFEIIIRKKTDKLNILNSNIFYFGKNMEEPIYTVKTEMNIHINLG